jgi:hypothetical protein
MGFVKSCGSSNVESSIVSLGSRERRLRRFKGFGDRGRERLRRSGIAAVVTGLVRIV